MSEAAWKLLARAYLTGYRNGQQIPRLQVGKLVDAPPPKFYGAAGGLIEYFRKELNVIVTLEWANEIVRGFENGLQS